MLRKSFLVRSTHSSREARTTSGVARSLILPSLARRIYRLVSFLAAAEARCSPQSAVAQDLSVHSHCDGAMKTTAYPLWWMP